MEKHNSNGVEDINEEMSLPSLKDNVLGNLDKREVKKIEKAKKVSTKIFNEMKVSEPGIYDRNGYKVAVRYDIKDNDDNTRIITIEKDNQKVAEVYLVRQNNNENTGVVVKMGEEEASCILNLGEAGVVGSQCTGDNKLFNSLEQHINQILG